MQKSMIIFIFFIIVALISCNPYNMPDISSDLNYISNLSIGMDLNDLNKIMANNYDSLSVVEFQFEINNQKYDCKVAETIYGANKQIVQYNGSGYTNSRSSSRSRSTVFANYNIFKDKMFFIVKENKLETYGFLYEFKSSTMANKNALGLAIENAYKLALKNRK